MGAVHRMAFVTISAAALMLAQVAPSQAASDPRQTCFGRAATIIGTPGPDYLIGGAEDVVVGLGGDDILDGGTACGGAGDDAFGSEPGMNNKWDGGSGNDQLMGDWGVDILLGGPGDDYIHDGDGEEDEPDWVDPGTDVMKGGPGNDWIFSVAGRNLVYGNGGDDWIRDYTHVRTVISGGAGNDTIDATLDNVYSPNPFQPDRVAGDAGRDSATVNRIDRVSSTENVYYVD